MNDPFGNPLLEGDFSNPLTADTAAYFNFDPNNIPGYNPDGADTGEEPDTYLVLPFNTKGGARNPFAAGITSNQKPPEEVTASELQQMWRDSGQIQDQFGTIENWKSYLVETRPMLEDADWWNAEMTYAVGSRKWLAQQYEDIAWAPGEREELRRQIAADQGQARKYAYTQWLQRHEKTLQLYGIQPTIYNNDGDRFQWTGSAYQKVTKVDDSFDFSAFAKGVIKSALISAVTAGIGGVVSSYAATNSIAGALNNGMNAFRELVGQGIRALGYAPEALGLAKGGATYLGLLNQPTVTALEKVFEAVLTSNGLATAAGISSAVSSGAWSGPAAQAYEDAINANPNLIINIINQATNQDQGGYTPLGDQENPSQFVITNADFLPPGYILNQYGNIVHEDTGYIIRDGDLREDLQSNPATGANWIVFNAYQEPGGGGGGLSSTALSQSDAAMEAWNEAKENALASGLTGSEYSQAMLSEWLSKGYTREDLKVIQARDDYSGIYSEDVIDTMYESAPELVIYNGDVKLLDENGVWENGGTFMDRSDPNNPRRYFVWRNKDTGQEIVRYEDELDFYDGTAKEFEAWMGEIPDLTDEERAFAERLLGLGDSPSQIYQDILASRDEIDDDLNNTTVGDPCAIGSYDGVYIESPTSGAVVCDITVSIDASAAGGDDDDDDDDDDSDGDDDGDDTTDTTTTPVEGAECTLDDGTAGTIQGGVCTAPDRTTQLPSNTCPSGFEYPDGVCVAVDDVSGGNSNGGDNNGGDTTLQPGDEGYCDMERPTGPNGEYTFETQAWDRFCGGGDDGGDDSDGGGDDGDDTTLQPGDEGFCDTERPLGPNGEYTFATQTWDRYCGGSDNNGGGDDNDGGDDVNDGGPQPGDVCVLRNGEAGVIDETGTCVAVGVGGTCTLQNGQAGTIDANGNCVAGDGSGNGNGDGDGNGNGDGDGDGDGDGIGDGPGGGSNGGGFLLGGGRGSYNPTFGGLFPVDPGPGYKGKKPTNRPVRGFLDGIRTELNKR